MTSEQLQHARAERWRQAANPILTSDDATAWIEEAGLCLFLPRHAQFSVPAPSFVEAAMGAPSVAPGREAIENATAMLRQLTATGDIVPLNLFGAAGTLNSDQPDFLAHRALLPYVFSMIGGRNWKSGPGMNASPLMTEVWTLLNREDALTAPEMQSALGRELTEAAILRSLVDLWHGLRALPVYDGQITRWELTQVRFAAELTASQKVAQTTALSVLVASYLDSVVAASAEEIETFLSPLTARSRIREVVNGLSATRQLGIVSVAAQPLLHVAGTLPEFAEEPPAKTPPARAARETQTRPDERPERRPFARERKPFERPFERKDQRPSGRPFERKDHKPADHKDRKPFQRKGRRPFENQDRKPFQRGDRKPFERKDRKPFEHRRGEGRPPERGAERGFGAQREHGDRERRGKDRNDRGFGGKKFGSVDGKKFGPGGAKKFHQEKSFGPPFRPEKRFGARGEEGRSGSPGSAGEARNKRPFHREQGGKFEGGKQRRFDTGSHRTSSGKPEGGFAKRGKPDFDRGEKRDFRKRESSGFRREERAGFGAEGRPKFPSGDRKKFEKRGDSFGKGEKPFAKPGKPFGKSSRPFDRSKPGSGKPGFGKAGKPGKPAFGARKPGGFKPPFRKRKHEGGENTE